MIVIRRMRIILLAIVVDCAKRQQIPTPIVSDVVQAILSESLQSNRVQACADKRVLLHCPKNTHILVENTFYGRLMPSSELCPVTNSTQPEGNYEDTSCDVTNAQTKVVAQCSNRRKCRVVAKPAFFGRDPCPTTDKYLQISYKCKPISFADQSFCQATSMELKCRPGKRLAIYSAEYGRTVDGHALECPSSVPLPYDCTVDVLAKLLPRCLGQKQCTAIINDGQFGSPCAIGVSKYLKLIFMCVNERIFSEAAIEGRLESMKTFGPAFVNRDQLAGSNAWTRVETRLKIPPLITKPTSTLISNDAAYQVHHSFTVSVTVTPLRITIPITSIPPHVPNAMVLLHDCLLTWQYMKANKEKVFLYFFLSASVGLILLLVVCIIQQGLRRWRQSEECQLEDNKSSMHTDRLLLNHFDGSMPGVGSSQYSPIYSDADPRNDFEVRHLDRNGLSFMRFDHLTSSRIPTVQHYFA